MFMRMITAIITIIMNTVTNMAPAVATIADMIIIMITTTPTPTKFMIARFRACH